jgi:hypothetical protein
MIGGNPLALLQFIQRMRIALADAAVTDAAVRSRGGRGRQQ